MIMCPTHLNIANFNLENCSLGAQNVSKDLIGAHTGEIAASQLKSYGVKYCIVGHSERRQDQKETNEEITKHQHVIFDFTDNLSLRYNDTRKFGRMYLVDKDKLEEAKPIQELGLEPWDDKLTSSYLKDKYKSKRLPIKTVILDQGIITGIGNIYANEILYLCGINPLKKYINLINSSKNINEFVSQYDSNMFYQTIQ